MLRSSQLPVLSSPRPQLEGTAEKHHHCSQGQLRNITTAPTAAPATGGLRASSLEATAAPSSPALRRAPPRAAPLPDSRRRHPEQPVITRALHPRRPTSCQVAAFGLRTMRRPRAGAPGQPRPRCSQLPLASSPPQHPARHLGAVATRPRVSGLGGQSPRTALPSADVRAGWVFSPWALVCRL